MNSALERGRNDNESHSKVVPFSVIIIVAVVWRGNDKVAIDVTTTPIDSNGLITLESSARLLTLNV